MSRSNFGSISKQRSGRFRARYTGPEGRWHNAPYTFLTKTDARAWLTTEHAKLIAGEWTPPAVRQAAKVTELKRRSVPFGQYADAWLVSRDLRPRTRTDYRSILDRHLVPAFGTTPVEAITPELVRSWYAGLDSSKPTMRAHTYALLRTILATAVEDDLVPANPCRIRGAGRSARVRDIKPATLAELNVIVDNAPEKYRLMVLMSAWLGLRFGEVTELRRRDIDLTAGTVRIERAVSRAAGGFVVGPPKTDAGVRAVAVPPHLVPAIRDQLTRVPADQDALLFSTPVGRHLAPSTVYRWWYPARDAAGRPDLRWHDLRHTGATLAAATGATIAELMRRIGHSTPAMAMRYQHAADDRDRAIADALSDIASGDVVPLHRRDSG